MHYLKALLALSMLSVLSVAVEAGCKKGWRKCGQTGALASKIVMASFTAGVKEELSGRQVVGHSMISMIATRRTTPRAEYDCCA